MFDLTEETLGRISVLVEPRIKGPPCRCGFASGDNWLRACLGNGLHRAGAIISLVRQNMVGFEAVQQSFNLSDVIAFAACQDQAQGVAMGIRGEMDLAADPFARTA